MYEINSTVEVEFVLQPAVTALPQTDYDVVVVQPVSGRVYTDSALTTYVAPTPTEQGRGTYSVLLSEAGRYRFTLSTGVGWLYQELSQVEIFVVDKTSITTAVTNSIQTTIACAVVVLT